MGKCDVFFDSIRVIQNSIGLLEKLDEDELTSFLEALNDVAGNIFLTGQGRTGLMTEAFAMRLTHLGYEGVYVVGYPTTPRIKSDDALLAASGSGETRETIQYVETAKEIGSKLFVITSNPQSTLAQMANHLLVIPGRTKERRREYEIDRIKGYHASLAPMGTLFEQNLSATYDAIIAYLAEERGITEERMRERHFE